MPQRQVTRGNPRGGYRTLEPIGLQRPGELRLEPTLKAQATAETPNAQAGLPRDGRRYAFNLRTARNGVEGHSLRALFDLELSSQVIIRDFEYHKIPDGPEFIVLPDEIRRRDESQQDGLTEWPRATNFWKTEEIRWLFDEALAAVQRLLAYQNNPDSQAHIDAYLSNPASICNL